MTLTDAELSLKVHMEVCPDLLASYATDPGLALEAALKASEGLDSSGIEIMSRGDLGGFRVEISYYDKDLWRSVEGIGSTLARALCIAALRAAGEEVEDDD